MHGLRVHAPGRLCLFGEHSDYLGLDVIPAAIDLNIEINANIRDDQIVTVDCVDISDTDRFKLGKPLEYRHKRDYIRSAFNVLAREGIRPEQGLDLVVTGDIPIAAGLSGSSALTIASVMTIAHAAQYKLDRDRLVRLAHQAEVIEFDEGGGMQDHFASAYGGIIHLDLGHDYRVTNLPAKLFPIVIGDSCEKKEDTVGDIESIKSIVESEYGIISKKIGSFNRRTTPVNMVYELSHRKPSRDRRMAEATLRNRDLTQRAYRLLSEANPDPSEVGRMLKEHHEILRDGLERSTPKIEKMIHAAYEVGALGCKINGSGGGGTMMAYATGCEREVASAIQGAGGTAYIVEVGKRATITSAE